MQCTAAVVGILAVTFAFPLAAQEWVQLYPVTAPPGLNGHAMAYDAANDRTVLFGGAHAGNVRVDETWLYDGADWSQASPAISPPPRAGHPMAYDPARGRVVLFGGIGIGTGALSDTWTWDGSSWQQMSPTTVPPGRLSHPLVWHPGRATCVMHGGNSLAGALADTWEWNGVDWQAIPTATAPTTRWAADMAYDPNGGGLVLFGGYPGPLSDTWYFDNVNWNQLAPATTPPGRWDLTLATDTVRGRVVMFGGTATADTWEFDGTDWSSMSPANLPPARGDDYMVYDSLRGQVMMFGGNYLNDTWAYQTPAQPGFAAAIPFGNGCVDEASATVYENFPTSTFDLSPGTLQLLPTGNGDGYALIYIPGAPAWFTPTSANLGLGDETVSGPHALGFPLSYPGGSTQDLYVSSNGFVWPQSGSPAEYYTGDPSRLFSGLPRWCPYWSDLDPSAGGTVHFDIDPTSMAAIVTFVGVPEWNNATSSQTFQIAFFPSGIVEMRLQACTSIGQAVLVGWSPGGGAKDPGQIDISALTSAVITSPDKTALWQRSDLRPVVGSTLSLTSGPIPPTAVLGAEVFGLFELNPPLDLTAIGMPSCFQYVSSDALQVLVPSGNRLTASFSVPASTTFAGVEIKTQSVVLVPGYNATGAITSNAIRLTLDVN